MELSVVTTDLICRGVMLIDSGSFPVKKDSLKFTGSSRKSTAIVKILFFFWTFMLTVVK